MQTRIKQTFFFQSIDPIERYIPLFLKLSVYIFLAYIFYEAITTFNEYTPQQHWPFLLSTVRMFTFLPIHEAGHFIFKFLGTTMMFLGGSFWQIMFPLLWFLIALKQHSHVAPFPLFWVGENTMDVSLYIRDAQYRALPLITGQSSSHDWYYLLSQWDALDSAGMLADLFYYTGFAIAMGGIVIGVFLAFFVCFKSKASTQLTLSKTDDPAAVLNDLLDKSLEERNKKKWL